MELFATVRRTIRDHALIDRGARVVAAVSGGSDSVALLHLLQRLDAAGDLQLGGVAHFNHQLRAAAVDEERFVAQMAVTVGRPLLADREDVAARAKREHRSMEDAARAARHAFFERARIHFDADCVALGHTRDDQAETYLLRLVRGAGQRGLGGMYPRNGRIIRPLIDCRRADLRAWLDACAIPFVDDESNADVTIPRNRVRAELLPLLEARFNPAIVDVLASEAELAREAWETLSALADELAARIVKATERVRTIDIEALRGVPAALRRVILWRTMTEAGGEASVGFDHVAAGLRLFESDGPAILDAPGQRLERIGPTVVLRSRPPGVTGRWSNPPGANLFQYPLSIPGEVVLAETGCVVSAEPVAAPSEADACATTGRGSMALVRSDLCRGRLTVRNRRQGDRFRPAGLDGRKSLQDYFVDRKVRRADRDSVPIVVDERGGIVWVAGYGIDEAFRVTDPAQAVLLLRLRRVSSR